MAGFFIDDNQNALVDPSGLRPIFGAAGIISATMSASTQELTIPAAAAAKNNAGVRIIMITTAAQPAYVAFDIAGQGASYTGATNMMLIPANAWMGFAIGSADAKVYVLQAGAAGPFCLTVFKTA